MYAGDRAPTGAVPIGAVARIDGNPSTPGVVLRVASAANLFSTAWVLLRDVGAAFRNSLLQATSTSEL